VCSGVGWTDPPPEGLPESLHRTNQGARFTTSPSVKVFPPELARSTPFRVPPLRLSSVRAPGLQRSKGCGGLWICGRTVCEETAAVRAGGGSVPSGSRATPHVPYPTPRADLKPSLSEPFSEPNDLFMRIPPIATLFPEGLAGLSGQSGGTTGGSSARTGTNGQVQGEA
jgi:hypothetical protein